MISNLQIPKAPQATNPRAARRSGFACNNKQEGPKTMFFDTTVRRNASDNNSESIASENMAGENMAGENIVGVADKLYSSE